MQPKLPNVINIYSDHIQKRIEFLEDEVNRNFLEIYNQYKYSLEEAYLEGIVEYETLLLEYTIKVEEANAAALSELEHIHKTCTPMRVISLDEIFFAQGIH